MAKKYLLLLIWIVLASCSLAVDTFGSGRWRYASEGLNPIDFLTTTPITATFEASNNASQTVSSVHWDVPSGCELQQGSMANLSTISFICSSAGDHKFGVTMNSDSNLKDTFYLKTVKDTSCYDWYVAIVSQSDSQAPASFLTPSAKSEIRVWIFNHKDTIENKNTGEYMGNTTIPSTDSQRLTRLFQSFGEMPLIQLQDPYDAKSISFLSPEYSSTGKYWKFEYTPIANTQYFGRFFGKQISVMNCNVRNRTVSMPVKKFENFLDAFSVTASTVPDSSLFSLKYHPAFPQVVVSLVHTNSRELIFTQTLFENSTVIDVPSAIIGNAVNITAATVSWNYILILSHVGLMYGNQDKAFTLSKFLDVTDSSTLSLDRISTIYSVDSLLEPDGSLSVDNQVMFAWNSDTRAMTETAQIWLSSDSGASFKPIPVPIHHSEQILEVVFLPAYRALSVLVQGNSTVVGHRLLRLKKSYFDKDFSIVFSSWEAGYSFVGSELIDSGMSGAVHITANSRNMLVYGDQLFISPDGGLTAVKSTIISRNANKPAQGLATNERIKTAAASACGDVAILTTNNRLFSGSDSINTIIELQSGIDVNVPADLVYNDQCNLLIVSAKATSASSEPLIYHQVPFQHDYSVPRPPLSTPLNSEVTCPYSALIPSSTAHYYLDMGDSATISAGVFACQTCDVRMAYSISNIDYINIEAQRHEKNFAAIDGDDVIEHTTVLVISETGQKASSYAVALEENTGESEVTFEPTGATIPCRSSQGGVKDTVRIRVGCPPHKNVKRLDEDGLHISAANCPAYESGGEFAKFQVAGVGPMIDYSVSDWGCPYTVLHGRSFRPLLGLYDGDDYKDSIEVNFVTTEINGREDYTYNATQTEVRILANQRTSKQSSNTITQAGCLSVSQSWSDVPDWSVANFKSCFLSDSSNVLPSGSLLPYEVLNRTGVSSLSFAAGDGIFIFDARIVDPQYSYCDLRIKFAVHIVGAPLPVYLVLSIVGGVTGVVLLLLLVSYFRYRYRILAHTKIE